MPKKRMFIGEILLDRGVISEEQLKEALREHKETHRRIGEILIARGFVKESEIGEILAEQLGFPFMDLSVGTLDTKALGQIPIKDIVRLAVVPVKVEGDVLTVAMEDPLDVSVIDEISALSGGKRIVPVLSTAGGIKNAIAYLGAGKIDSSTGGDPSNVKERNGEDDELIELEKEAGQISVIETVNRIIEDAVEKQASDIHLQPQEDILVIRFRIDGILRRVETPPIPSVRAVISRVKIMSGMNIAESRLPQDGRIELKTKGRDIDLRVASFPGIYGEHMAIRILDRSAGIMTPEELGLTCDDLDLFSSIISRPYGIILVTGPTGSGKSTTLYTALNEINDDEKNIITLEDPVEYTIPSITQSQINRKSGLTFAVGLRSMVRLDPDVIMIGEIRDRETADIAVRSALTGHLVFSSLHTNDAPSSIARLLDIGIEPYLAASSIVGVIAQRLVRKICPDCKEQYFPDSSETAVLSGAGLEGAGSLKLFRGKGCGNCLDTGYKGRTCIFEILVPGEEIKQLITEKAPGHEIRRSAERAGMRSLLNDGIRKAIEGITTLSEVVRVTE